MSLLKVIELKQTCNACPSQWDGKTDDGRILYVRYRWGYLSVCLGQDTGDEYDGVRGEEIYGESVGDALDGVMEERDMKFHTSYVLDWSYIV